MYKYTIVFEGADGPQSKEIEGVAICEEGAFLEVFVDNYEAGPPIRPIFGIPKDDVYYYEGEEIQE